MCRISLVGLVAFTMAIAAAGPLVSAQGKVPRTPDGHPDLQGLWDYRTATPLERPRDLQDKSFFTDELV